VSTKSLKQYLFAALAAIVYLPQLIGGGIIVLVVVLVVYFVHKNINSEDPPKKNIQQVTLIMPPPPPQEIQKQPEPEQEEVKIEEPEPVPEMPSDTPPGDALGMDADGAAGADGFGLAARKGRGLLEGGRFAWYGNLLQRAIHDALGKTEGVKAQAYTIVVNVWVAPSGKVNKVVLLNSTGSKSIDETIETALRKEIVLGEIPPADLPQPIRLRVISRL
jgi:periplasmic protein TonB